MESGINDIVGWSKNYWKGRRDATYEAFLDKFPNIDNIPDVGYSNKNTLSFEKIISLKPGVVIFAANDYDKVKDGLDKLKKAKIQLFLLIFMMKISINI